MNFITGLALLSGICSAVPAPQRPGWGWGWNSTTDGAGSTAVYFLRVDPAGSSVVAIEMDAEGLLTSSTTSTSTGGVGLQSQNYTNNLMPTAIDPLQGQQAVSIGGNYLFTINSGSNTAVMFSINPEDPLDLQMVGAPAPTLGEFAMSIAYSSKYNKACVLNGGVVNGVACFSVSPESGLVPDGVGLREFGYSSTTPPQLGGPQGSGSDVQFSLDSSKLITTFKGQNTPMTLGHISVFEVDESGNVASAWTDNQVNPIQGPFGFALSGSDAENIFVTDVAYGGALVSLDYSTNEVSLVSVVNSTTFSASCWATWSPVTNNYYDINAGDTEIGVVDSAGILTNIIDYNTTLGGATDAVVMGSIMYYLTAVNAIAVMDLESGQLLQQYTYSDAANRPFWTGMAMYPASPILTGGLYW